MAEEEKRTAGSLLKQMKTIDTSGVEVDEEQVAPTIAAGSAEEAAVLAEMEKLVQAAGNAEAIAADEGTKLLCLRGRKYEPARAAELLPKLLELKSEFGIGGPAGEQLIEDLHSHKILASGAKDADGRAIIWVRLRHHDPKKSKAPDMARLVTTNMLHALKDPDVQRLGVTIINDMSGLKLKNLDPSAAKAIMMRVFPCLPIRVGRICIFNPPWFIGHVILPVFLTFMSKKV